MRRSALARLGLVAILAGVYVTGVTLASEKTASGMATAAQKWLASLTPEQREQAALPFEAPDRTSWHYVPNEQWQRKGVTLGTMTDQQKAEKAAKDKAAADQEKALLEKAEDRAVANYKANMKAKGQPTDTNANAGAAAPRSGQEKSQPAQPEKAANAYSPPKT